MVIHFLLLLSKDTISNFAIERLYPLLYNKVLVYIFSQKKRKKLIFIASSMSLVLRCVFLDKLVLTFKIHAEVNGMLLDNWCGTLLKTHLFLYFPPNLGGPRIEIPFISLISQSFLSLLPFPLRFDQIRKSLSFPFYYIPSLLFSLRKNIFLYLFYI